VTHIPANNFSWSGKQDNNHTASKNTLDQSHKLESVVPHVARSAFRTEMYIYYRNKTIVKK